MSVNVVDHPSRDRIPGEALLSRARDLLLGFLTPRLDDLLAVLDDDLFEHAEAARSDRTQQSFFDAMRLLRMEREPILARFRADLEQRENAGDVALPAANTPEQGDFQTRIDSLSLLEDDALEERLAIATMSQRVERDCDLELTLVRARIMCLLESVDGARVATPPVDPRRIARAWAAAISSLEFESDVRLVVNKRFEHSVLRELGLLYADLNRLLAGAGVLPQLNPTQAAARIDGKTATSRPLTSAQGPVLDQEAGDLLNALTDLTPQTLPDTLAGLPGLRQRRRFSGDPAAPQMSPDAASVMSRLMIDIASAAQARLVPILAERSLDSVPRRIDYGDLLARGAERRGHGEARLDDADEDVVNLVQMLFDQLLADDNLPVPIRALLARIQFPILRIALSDASFIGSVEHPARGFLNLITRTGIGWVRGDERAQDRLYQVIESCVGELATRFEGDPALIEGLNTRIEDALAAEEELVKRATERVLAKERARLEAEKTRRLVARLVEHRCVHVQNDELRRFLGEDWQQVMYRAHQHEGPRSPGWKSAFAVLRALSGAGDLAGRELHEALERGLEKLGRTPESVAQSATRALELLLQEAEAQAQMPSADAATPGAVAPPSRIEPGIEQLPNRGAIDAASALAIDDWIEVRRDDGRAIRCRLATVTEPPERCIFLNRRGVRMETLSRLEIAAAIEQGQLRRLDADQLFDSALASVIGSLRAETDASTHQPA